jgi:hypothetical protein
MLSGIASLPADVTLLVERLFTRSKRHKIRQYLLSEMHIVEIFTPIVNFLSSHNGVLFVFC